MKQLYSLQKSEREEEIIKRLIYYIRCDIEALECEQTEKTANDKE